MLREQEEAVVRIKKLDAFLAVSFVTSCPDLRRRGVELEDPGAELDDTCEYLAELAFTMLEPRGNSRKMRAMVKAALKARVAEWFGSDDGILRILESEEAQTIAEMLGPDVERDVCAYVADRQRLLAARKPN